MNTLTAQQRLIVALDAPAEESRALAAHVRGTAGWVKVGMTLFYRNGPSVVTDFLDAGFDVFLDLKLHDIPHQVQGAARSVASLGAGMLTVHAAGGAAMVAAAVAGAAEGAEAAGVAPPKILAVTVLTSMSDAELNAIGVESDAATQVPRLARLAVDAGADGIVCSPNEAAAMRELLGDEALIVTPGVRPAGASLDDQTRCATPAAALQAGASHLVIGRPITAAADPAQAANRILAEMEEALA